MKSSAGNTGLQFRAWLPLVIAFLTAGCKTAPSPPAADFSALGWRVQHGQAVWKPSAQRPEFAGDLLLATNANGNFFAQLTKDPFPLVTAESMDGQWQIEFGADEHPWRGHGAPPERFVWFQLPRALLGEPLASNWHFITVNNNSWRLENTRTGEILEGGFFP